MSNYFLKCRTQKFDFLGGLRKLKFEENVSQTANCLKLDFIKSNLALTFDINCKPLEIKIFIMLLKTS